MMKNLSVLAAALIALGVASSPALAVGTSARTFVSAAPPGNDTGTCPTTAPCRTFAYALTQTAPSGEIIVLTSGGYGAVIIGQAVSIINTSNFAGVTVASGGTGITIAAGTTDSVTLRGLTIDGGGAGANGIAFNSGGALTIDQCNLMNFVGTNNHNTLAGNGIIFQPTSGIHNISVTNTRVTNNANMGVFYFPPTGSTATAFIAIDHVSANNNTDGMVLNNSNVSGGNTKAKVTVSNSTANDNSQIGFDFADVTATLDASYASGNLSEGVTAPNSVLALSRSVIVNNFVGVDASDATVNSYNDNRITENSMTDVGGTLITISPK